MTCPQEAMGLTCPTREKLREFTEDGSRSPICPHELTGRTCPTRDPLTSLSPGHPAANDLQGVSQRGHKALSHHVRHHHRVPQGDGGTGQQAKG